MSDCYDGCSTGDCDVCGLYTDTFKGWRGAWLRFKARVIRLFTGRDAPVEPGQAAAQDWSYPASGEWDLGILPAGGGERVSFGTFSGSYGAACRECEEKIVHLALTKGEAIAGNFDVRKVKPAPAPLSAPATPTHPATEEP